MLPRRTPLVLLVLFAASLPLLGCDTDRGAAPTTTTEATPKDSQDTFVAATETAAPAETKRSPRKPLPIPDEKPVEPTVEEHADEAEAKLAAVRELLVMNKSDQLSDQMTNSLVQSFASASPSVPSKTWNEISTILEKDKDTIDETLIPVYTKNFSLQELRDLIAFYKSPTGQRFRQIMPKVARDTQRLTTEWGQRRAKRIEALLKERGHLTNVAVGGPVPPKLPNAKEAAAKLLAEEAANKKGEADKVDSKPN